MKRAKKKSVNYAAAIRKSGLTHYDAIEVGSPLWIPSRELERLLDKGLRGIPTSGIPNRTRSKMVKSRICENLGYPIPKSFKRCRPRFFGQDFDAYVQAADNLQVWNDQLSPTRRYVLIRPPTRRADCTCESCCRNRSGSVSVSRRQTSVARNQTSNGWHDKPRISNASERGSFGHSQDQRRAGQALRRAIRTLLRRNRWQGGHADQVLFDDGPRFPGSVSPMSRTHPQQEAANKVTARFLHPPNRKPCRLACQLLLPSRLLAFALSSGGFPWRVSQSEWHSRLPDLAEGNIQRIES